MHDVKKFVFVCCYEVTNYFYRIIICKLDCKFCSDVRLKTALYSLLIIIIIIIIIIMSFI